MELKEIKRPITKSLLRICSLSLLLTLNFCSFGDPDAPTDTMQQAQLLQAYINNGAEVVQLLVSDDQGDGAIGSFSLISNGSNYDITLNYSTLRLDTLQSEIALRGENISKTLLAQLSKLFDSALYAHDSHTTTASGATTYKLNSALLLNNFHIASSTLPSGAAFKSEPQLLTALKAGTINQITLHISDLVLGGTVTAGATKNFELRLPPFDVTLKPNCQLKTFGGTEQHHYAMFRIHNLFKDNTNISAGKIVEQIYNSSGVVNNLAEPALTAAILENLTSAFQFHGCQL